MTIEERLRTELKHAIKANEKEKLAIVRQLLSTISYAQIEKRGDLTDEEGLKVLAREAKKREEAIELYRQGKREDLASKEERELAFIRTYLPQPIGEEAVKKIVSQVKARSKVAEFGPLMSLVMKELKGKAEGSLVAKLVKQTLEEG